jgi:excisionase family DNA binding protein
MDSKTPTETSARIRTNHLTASERSLDSRMNDLTNEVKAHPSEEGRMQRLLTKTESAQYCQVQTRTIDNWMKRGLIPYYKIGKSVRFRIDDIQTHLDKNCRVARRV